MFPPDVGPLLRVGAKTPANVDKAGAPMDLYALAAFAIPPLGAFRVPLGLHVQLPAWTKIVLQTRANFQRRRLTVTNPALGPNQELTMLVTNASHTKQRVSRGACVARARLHHSTPKDPRVPAYHKSPSYVSRPPRCVITLYQVATLPTFSNIPCPL